MNIPDKIIAIIDENGMSFNESAQVFSAVISYIRNREVPVEMEARPKEFFLKVIRPELDIVLERRRKAAEYRRRRKLALEQQRLQQQDQLKTTEQGRSTVHSADSRSSAGDSLKMKSTGQSSAQAQSPTENESQSPVKRLIEFYRQYDNQRAQLYGPAD